MNLFSLQLPSRIIVNEDGTTQMRLLAECCALASTAIGLIVLVGWAASIESLKAIVSGYSTMKPDTAACFLAGGLSLWFIVHKSTWPPRLALANTFAVVVAITAYASLLLNALASDASSPSRMATATALSFGLLGPALWLIQSKRPPLVLVAQWFALTSLVIALVGLLGYSVDATVLRSVAPYSSVALHTTVAMAVLALGILYARPQSGFMADITAATPGAAMARRVLLTGMLLVPMLSLTKFTGRLRTLPGAEFDLVLIIAASSLFVAIAIWFSARSLNRHHHRLAASEAHYHLLFEANPLPVLAFDPATLSILEANQAASEFYGFSLEEFRGLSLDDIRPPGSDSQAKQPLPPVSDVPQRTSKVVQRRKDGRKVEVAITTRRIEVDGRSVGLGVINEMPELASAETPRPTPAVGRSAPLPHAGVALPSYFPRTLRDAAKVLTFPGGTFLFQPGDSSVPLCRILKGQASLVYYAPDGEQLVLQRAVAGDWLAESGLHGSRAGCAALAEGPCIVQMLPAKIVRETLAREPKFALAWGLDMAALANRLHRHLARIFLYQGRERIVHYLLTESPAHSGELTLPFFQQAWAVQLGMDAATLSRTLTKMIEEGSVSRQGRTFRLLNGKR